MGDIKLERIQVATLQALLAQHAALSHIYYQLCAPRLDINEFRADMMKALGEAMSRAKEAIELLQGEA